MVTTTMVHVKVLLMASATVTATSGTRIERMWWHLRRRCGCWDGICDDIIDCVGAYNDRSLQWGWHCVGFPVFTDATACNYNDQATLDDGSCESESQVQVVMVCHLVVDA